MIVRDRGVKIEGLVDTELVTMMVSSTIYISTLVGSTTGATTFRYKIDLSNTANLRSGRRPNCEERIVLRVERGNQNVRRNCSDWPYYATCCKAGQFISLSFAGLHIGKQNSIS